MNKLEHIKEMLNNHYLIHVENTANVAVAESSDKELENFMGQIEQVLYKTHVYTLLNDDYQRNGKLSPKDAIQYTKIEKELNNLLEILLAEEHDYVFDPPIDIRTCKECGCTDLHACPGGCHWVTDDLCSNCVYRVYAIEGKRGFFADINTTLMLSDDTTLDGIDEICIAEEVISTEEVDAIMHGYSTALKYTPLDDDEEILLGNQILVFQVVKGEEIVGTYYYKKSKEGLQNV